MPNYFAPKQAAARYARGRFFYQPQIVACLRERLPLNFPVACAVDVACGTGNSTLALVEVATQVIGVDPSAEMLSLAVEDERITYRVGPAEHLPIGDDACDLITIASAFHWMEHAAALAEAYRVLRAGGWLAIYDNLFAARMRDRPDFTPWFQQVYQPSFPGPTKPHANLDDPAATQGLRFVELVTLDGEQSFTRDSFIGYLTSISNTQVAIQNGRPIEEIEGWLRAELAPFFAGLPTATFQFQRPIWLLEHPQ